MTEAPQRDLRTRARLQPDQALAIAERIAAGERQVAVAKRFDISVETVSAIKSGKRWSDVIGDELRKRMQAASPIIALDEAAARGIMRALEAGHSGRCIAEEYGISASMVSAIKHGRAWGRLDPELPARLGDKPQQGKALTVARVAAIKRRLLDGRSSRKVAAEFGVSPSTVLSIGRGNTWADVKPASVEDEEGTMSDA